ncbi:N-6 DNA methylase [Azospira sp.]|jgi:type I restriction enzyme M protein|uniref:N-6 DNA methylase n=1 Tax=Azospira sp. TaxID=1872671 RepID=UPI00255E21DA|nr:N-6 DNA methylase [Azospira sp.]MDK9690205.1 N-6 DNA methylase [Azospira sp.]
MLDSNTKRRIDSCRDILVGKVPDPKSQVEQITIALIYKFMDDMDAEAEELGGKRSFFAGEYAKYGWARLMAPNMGGFDVLALYSEAIGKMNENPGIPALFRDIFKNAYLPYRDPETLRAFLKEIDGFTYDHSERLGDAFEYLLSVLGSQGDAGQFRTPRHIIDFMVEIIDPKKNESVLDPACGTAGFLISAWKHILKQNTKTRAGDLLTPEERATLVANIHGYDISPDMVRLSLVNLYLHGFTDPHIVEYDTLTSEERWNETADIILANPPFMSPKGGIKPHKRFSVQATRSEVLFVDYIAEHLSPQGRAAIVVPEGIIFQSGTAYKKLREMLVKTSLVAVVSLPAGVFNPYSGVKTSILILDKRLAKNCDSVLFVKVENDGFNLGAQRRAVTGSDLPEAARVLREWMGGLFDEESPVVVRVERGRIGESADWNLSGDRYVETTSLRHHAYPLTSIGEVLDRVSESIDPMMETGTVAYVGLENIETNSGRLVGDVQADYSEIRSLKAKFSAGDVLYGKLRPNLNKVYFAQMNGICSTDIFVFRAKSSIDPRFVSIVMRSPQFNDEVLKGIGGAQLPRVGFEHLKNLMIPLPPLAIQQEIVAEIEGYQKIIDGARQVVENYRPRINVQPDWPCYELGTIANLINGRAYKQEELLKSGPTPVLRVGNFFSNRSWYYSDLELTPEKYCEAGDLLYAWSASFGPRIWDGPRAIFHYHIWKIMVSDRVEKKWLFHLLEMDSKNIKAEGSGIAMLHATKGGMEKRLFPVPDLETQRAIVAEIEAEQALVDANKQLIERFEAKIKATINRVWGSSA